MGKRNKANTLQAPPEASPWAALSGNANAGATQYVIGNVDVEIPEYEPIDNDVLDLCDHFHIDEFRTRKLNRLLLERKDTFEDDMLRLWTDLQRSKNPNTLLNTLIKHLDQGTFVGKTQADPELADLIRRYKLDDQAEMKLTDVLSRHDDKKKKQYYRELEDWLEASTKTSATACMLLKKIGAGDSLGPAPRGKGKGKGKGRSRSARRSRSPHRQREPESRNSRDANEDYRRSSDRDRYSDRDRHSDRHRESSSTGRAGHTDRDRYERHRDSDRARDERQDYGWESWEQDRNRDSRRDGRGRSNDRSSHRERNRDSRERSH